MNLGTLNPIKEPTPSAQHKKKKLYTTRLGKTDLSEHSSSDESIMSRSWATFG